MVPSVFFFTHTATTEIYTLSLHDALPIWCGPAHLDLSRRSPNFLTRLLIKPHHERRRAILFITLDRKSTRLNSSHGYISYAVFCLKKKKTYHIKLPQLSRQTYRNSHRLPH